MAHEITSQDTPVFVGQPAWHKLGTVITVEQAETMSHFDLAVMAGLDFPVEKIEVRGTWISPTGELHVVEFDDYAGIVRTDGGQARPLSIQGDGYTIAPNRELSDILDGVNLAAHDGKVLRPEAGVSLKGGKVVILTSRFLDTITLPGGDVIEPFLFASNSHDGTSATKVRSCMFRVVCANTHRAALAGSAKIDLTVRHTANREDRMNEGKKVLAFGINDVRNFEAEARRMIDTTVAEDEFAKIVAGLFEPKNDSD
jgi:phage/plasmid-like protein (TIGR03299 family)